jgi:hypothetical protein
VIRIVARIYPKIICGFKVLEIAHFKNLHNPNVQNPYSKSTMRKVQSV